MFDLDKVSVLDNFFPEDLNEKAIEYFQKDVEWKFGAKSVKTMMRQSLSHWVKYLFQADSLETGVPVEDITFKEEVVQSLFEQLTQHLPKDTRLLRCYANGMTYGIDGKLHHDDARDGTFTVLYYPMKSWFSDWAGETIFWNKEKYDVEQSVHPKSNRIIVFPAKVWHGARPVSRYCEELRITLMWKFIVAPPPNDQQQLQESLQGV